MRRKVKDRDPAVQVGLLVIGLALAAALLPGEQPAANPPKATVDLQTAGGKARRGPQGKRGPEGPRGPRGERGPDGFRGERGPEGSQGASASAAADTQFVQISWQNGDYGGKAVDNFVAPGIGEGHVRCSPPSPSEPDGVQWIRFFPYDNGSKTEPPDNWATTMWTERIGGNVDDANHQTTNVTRTARLDRANQQSGFHESLNTASVGHTPESIGSIDGIITTEPFDESTDPPPPTTFRLSWHWNFRNPGSARCYLTATFITEAS